MVEREHDTETEKTEETTEQQATEIATEKTDNTDAE